MSMLIDENMVEVVGLREEINRLFALYGRAALAASVMGPKMLVGRIAILKVLVKHHARLSEILPSCELDLAHEQTARFLAKEIATIEQAELDRVVGAQ